MFLLLFITILLSGCSQLEVDKRPNISFNYNLIYELKILDLSNDSVTYTEKLKTPIKSSLVILNSKDDQKAFEIDSSIVGFKHKFIRFDHVAKLVSIFDPSGKDQSLVYPYIQKGEEIPAFIVESESRKKLKEQVEKIQYFERIESIDDIKFTWHKTPSNKININLFIAGKAKKGARL